jgi:hypothetical protein
MIKIGRLALVGLLFCVSVAAWSDTVLMASHVTSAPSVDGVGTDLAWRTAKPLNVPLDFTPYNPSNGYPGATSTDAVIKAAYTNDKIYFLIKWNDPTKSLERFPWVKQADGSWAQNVDKDSTGHENTYYEDKFAMLWNINSRTFGNAGCAVLCHMNADDVSAGRKYTALPEETVDMWHWKGVRTGPLGQIDDQHIDSNTDPAENSGWGRKGDTKTGGGYYNNAAGGEIRWQNPRTGKVAGDEYWIFDSEKEPFVDTYRTGDKIAGIVIAPFEGPRADIAAEAVWANGSWTLEIERNLVTVGANSETQDVQFTDLTKSYPFGVAAFDNSQINHLFHWNKLTMEFEQ